jgi:hypothetical protein
VQLSWARLTTDAAEVAAGPEETAAAMDSRRHLARGGVVHGGPVGNHGAGGAAPGQPPPPEPEPSRPGLRHARGLYRQPRHVRQWHRPRRHHRRRRLIGTMALDHRRRCERRRYASGGGSRLLPSLIGWLD